jgi:hypothetical protein
MVYYLRPRNHNQQESSYRFSADSSSETEDKTHEAVPYLVIILLVTVISTLVILLGVKPDSNGFSFLCVKQDDGTCKVSNVRVMALSLLLGLLVAAGIFGVNKAKPGLLVL